MIRQCGVLVCLIAVFVLLVCLALPTTAQAAGADGLKLGTFFSDGIGEDTPPTCCQPSDQLPQWETSAGRKADIFLWYQSIFYGGMDSGLMPIAENGRTIELALAFPNVTVPGTGCSPGYPDNQLQHIINGDYDECISWYAYDLWQYQQQYRGRLIIRPLSEMNGYWTDWGCGNPIDYWKPEEQPPPNQCPNPDDLVVAWQHLHDKLNENLTLNGVPSENWPKWLWSPNVDGSPSAAQYTFDHYYPGDAYVDYIGASGYNWGTFFDPNAPWRTFDQIFDASLAYYTSHTGKPVMISETSSAEEGGNKAQWISDTFNSLSQTDPPAPAWHSRVKSLTWFNEDLPNLPDLRVESNPSVNWPAFESAAGQASISWSRLSNLYWASYADYLNSLMSVDYLISNNTNFDHSYGILTSWASNGVTLAGPTDLGSIAGGTWADQVYSNVRTLKYHMPQGIHYFSLTIGIGEDDATSPSIMIEDDVTDGSSGP